MEKGSLWLRTILDANGLSIDDSQCDLLERYCGLLLEWNKKVNLISRRSEGTIWEEQILHSISFLTRVQLKNTATVIDLGTGGGLPGIPLRVLMPGFSMTLLDSIKKKIDAVQSIIQTLEMKNIKAVCSRAEDLNRGTIKRTFYDYVICRSVGKLEQIWENGCPLLQSIASTDAPKNIHTQSHIVQRAFIKPGVILALKGGDIQEEIKVLERRNKKIAITVLDISLNTSERLANPDKKVVIMRSF